MDNIYNFLVGQGFSGQGENIGTKGQILYTGNTGSYVYVPANMTNATSMVSIYNGNNNSNKYYETFLNNIRNGNTPNYIISFSNNMSQTDHQNRTNGLLKVLRDNNINITSLGLADLDDSNTSKLISELLSSDNPDVAIAIANLSEKNIKNYEDYEKVMQILTSLNQQQEAQTSNQEQQQTPAESSGGGGYDGGGYFGGGGGYSGGGGGGYSGGCSGGGSFDGGATSSGLSNTGTLPTSTGALTPASNGQVNVSYDGVVGAVNDIVASINSTEFPVGSTDYKSTSALLPSISNANNYFFQATETLLKGLSNDTQNIEQMLKNYATIDSQLANSAYNLNGQNLSLADIASGNYGNNIAIDKATIAASYKNLLGAFSNNYSEGKVGSIQMSDINSIFSGGKLGGSIGSALENEISAAKGLQGKIDNLISSTSINAPSWDLIKNRLADYSSLCDLRAKSAGELQDAYEEALKLVHDYVEPDEYLDDGEIPEYEAKIAADKKEVARLEAQNAELDKVECVPLPCDEKTGGGCGMDCSARDAAQAQIAANNIEINRLNEEIAKFEAFVAKLKGLADIMNRANDMITNAINKIESEYMSKIDEMNPVELDEAAQNAGPVAKTEGLFGKTNTPIFYSQLGYIDENGKRKEWKSSWQKGIAGSGCGPTSLAACLATMTGDTSITPSTVANEMTRPNDNMEFGFVKKYCSKYGYDYATINKYPKSYLDTFLRNGGTAVNVVQHGGHYVAVLGINDEKQPPTYIVCDPIDNKHKEWTRNELSSRSYYIAPPGKTVDELMNGTVQV